MQSPRFAPGIAAFGPLNRLEALIANTALQRGMPNLRIAVSNDLGRLDEAIGLRRRRGLGSAAKVVLTDAGLWWLTAEAVTQPGGGTVGLLGQATGGRPGKQATGKKAALSAGLLATRRIRNLPLIVSHSWNSSQCSLLV